VFTAVQRNIPVAGPWVSVTPQLAEDDKYGITGRFKRWEAVFEEVSHTYDQVSGSLEPMGKDARWESSIMN
jgi:hypothetical protein